MLSMCAFAILFSGILSLVTGSEAVGGLGAVMAGLLEVTAGAVAASQVGGLAGFIMTSCALSFGGCSVLFQIMSCFRAVPIRFGPFLLSRLAHAGLGLGLALPFYLALGESAPVWLAKTPPLFYATSENALLSVCVLAMCAILSMETFERFREEKQ
jgi:hypothetical protein